MPQSEPQFEYAMHYEPLFWHKHDEQDEFFFVLDGLFATGD